MNINPVANGNKTQSGVLGMLNVFLTAGVYAVLKAVGVDNAEITAIVVNGIMNGMLTLVGIIHKRIKKSGSSATL